MLSSWWLQIMNALYNMIKYITEGKLIFKDSLKEKFYEYSLFLSMLYISYCTIKLYK